MYELINFCNLLNYVMHYACSLVLLAIALTSNCKHQLLELTVNKLEPSLRLYARVYFLNNFNTKSIASSSSLLY